MTLDPDTKQQRVEPELCFIRKGSTSYFQCRVICQLHRVLTVTRNRLCSLLHQEIYGSPETHLQLREFCFLPVWTQDTTNRVQCKPRCPWVFVEQRAYRNLRGVVKNHTTPTSDTFLLLRGKIVCKNFPFDFCYPNNSSLNWNANINLIMTPLRHILWGLISNDLRGFALPHFLHSFPAKGFASSTSAMPSSPPPTHNQHHRQGGKKDPKMYVLRWLPCAWEYPLI